MMENNFATAESQIRVYLYCNFRQMSEQLSMEDVFRRIKGGMYECVVYALRREKKAGCKEKADGLKKTLKAICVSASYRGRRLMENLTEYFPQLVLDIDGIPADQAPLVRDKAASLPFTLLSFVSPGGEGVKIVCHTPGNPEGLRGDELNALHHSYFKALSQYYECRLGWKIDPSGSDIGRLMLIGSDRDAYCVDHWPSNSYIGDFPIFDPSMKRSVRDADTPVAATDSRISPMDVKRFLAARDELRRQGEEYLPHNHNNYLYKMARKLNAFGVSQEVSEALVKENFKDYSPNEEQLLVASAYTNHHDEFGTAQSSPTKNKVSLKEIEAYLSAHYRLRFNVITSRLEKSEDPEGKHYAPLDDYGENSIYRDLWLHGWIIRKTDLYSLLHSDFIPRFHPFISYIDSLPAWDGKTDYIAQLAATVTVDGDQDKWARNFKKWFVAMVASWLRPGVVNHVALIFVGAQGVYKTTWITHLLPPELQSYLYSGPVNPKDKDHILNLSHCALINNEEMDTLSGDKLNHFKSMISQEATNERAAYGHNTEYHPRCASFAGSTNVTEMICDSTGLRRWLVEVVLNILSPIEHPFSYTGIYSQAKSLIDSGFRYWFDSSEVREINADNEIFELKTVEEEMVRVYFRIPVGGETYVSLTAAQVLQKISSLVHTPMYKSNVGKALKKIGFPSRMNHGISYYQVVELSFDEIQASKSLL